jgi:hypothetical protein
MTMSALIVVESYFGNTRRIAEVIGEVLRTEGLLPQIVDVRDAPIRLPEPLDLLVVGAPTHDLGMSTPESRQAACARQGRPAPAVGVREWIDQLEKPVTPPWVAVYDTRFGYPWLSGSAAAQASVRLSGKGFRVFPARASFRVQDITGPLNPGAEEDARRWIRALADRMRWRLRTARR